MLHCGVQRSSGHQTFAQRANILGVSRPDSEEMRGSLLSAITAPAGVESGKICGICVPERASAIAIELRSARASAGNT